MLAILLLLAGTVAEPAPSPPLKTITRVHASPLCTTLKGSVLFLTQGLQANDRLIESSKPLLLQMGQDFIPVSDVGKSFGARARRFAGAHDPSPALLLDNEHLAELTNEIVHNFAIIDAMLNDPERFPTTKSDDDQKVLLLKAELQAVADRQRGALNILYGLSDTLSLQELVAKGDGMQGATGGGGAAGAGQADQDVSFRDILSASDRGRGLPVDPTVDQDPAVSQAPSSLSNNPLVRFYLGVAEDQKNVASAENVFTQTVLAAVKFC
jgi:hypothetical protein